MGSEDLQKRRKQARKERKSKEIELRSETWLIVCEGTKTEPQYFIDLIEYINSVSKKKIKYKVEGTGRNTKSLVESVEDFFYFSDNLINKAIIRYAKVFTVFDKDDFTNEAFNTAIKMSEDKGYIPLWSNQCIELWFLLHFEYLQSDISRNDYFKKLSSYVGQKYNKNSNNFELLGGLSNINKAFKNSKKMYNSFKSNNPSKMSPCTTIFKLFEKIEEYMKD